MRPRSLEMADGDLIGSMLLAKLAMARRGASPISISAALSALSFYVPRARFERNLPAALARFGGGRA